RFLIDGFPRKSDQAIKFDIQTSGREVDNKESIKKRCKTFVGTLMLVDEYYKK
ncbi:hypothetical protein BY996DRAFT_4531097, partial [Phakopsora pachyrhizi]